MLTILQPFFGWIYNAAVLAGFIPPQEESVLQHIDGTKTPVFNFDTNRQTRITLDRSFTITSEYQCYNEQKILPYTPDNTEVWFAPDSGFIWFINSSKQLLVAGNGLTQTVVHPLVETDEEHIVRLEIKDDSLKVILDGVESEITGITWTSLTHTSVFIGGQSGANGVSGFSFYFKDCDKTYTPDNVLSDPNVTITDPNNTLFKYDFGKDLTGRGNYVLYNIATGGIIPIPVGVPDQATLEAISGLVAGTEYTRAQLDAIHNALLIFTSPIPANSSLNPNTLYRSVIYQVATILTQDQINALIEYVGRTVEPESSPLMFGGDNDDSVIVNDNGDLISGGP